MTPFNSYVTCRSISFCGFYFLFYIF